MDGIDLDGPDPLNEQIALVIARRIEDGTYEINRRIPSEQQLADEFDVSRPTIRAALARLIERGMVRAVRGRGTYAVRPDDASPPAGQ